MQIFATVYTHLDFEYSASEPSIVLVVFSAEQVSHPEVFNEVRNSFSGELKWNVIFSKFSLSNKKIMQ